jgi:hypothetical protein
MRVYQRSMLTGQGEGVALLPKLKCDAPPQSPTPQQRNLKKHLNQVKNEASWLGKGYLIIELSSQTSQIKGSLSCPGKQGWIDFLAIDGLDESAYSIA